MPPSRTAVLIEASKVPQQDELLGAVVDVTILRQFLESATGGAWESDEIIDLHTPNLDKLQAALRRAACSDYSFVSFSGHGEHLKGMGLDESVVLLGDRTEIPVSRLNPGSSRCTIVADSCRGIRVLEERVARGMVKLARGDSSTRSRHRALFDEQLDGAEAGAILLYSCNLDESAQETELGGGVFTSSLVHAGEDFGQSSPIRSVQTIRDAFQTASVMTTRRYSQQHPQIQPGRRLRYFPFAVRA
jgi:hypothetical protein